MHMTELSANTVPPELEQLFARQAATALRAGRQENAVALARQAAAGATSLPAAQIDEWTAAVEQAAEDLSGSAEAQNRETLISYLIDLKIGAKAAQELRATIKVIRAQNSTASTSEIKSAVLAEMNNYFSIDKWNFGDTFYFSELAAYLHAEMGGIISSVVLVPLNPQKSFGDLYEIRSAPNQIFVNAANVNNVEVITALTSTNIRTAPGSGVI